MLARALDCCPLFAHSLHSDAVQFSGARWNRIHRCARTSQRSDSTLRTYTLTIGRTPRRPRVNETERSGVMPARFPRKILGEGDHAAATEGAGTPITFRMCAVTF